MMIYHQTKFACKEISFLEESRHILIIKALITTSTLKAEIQPFCMTIWLTMMHHHTNSEQFRRYHPEKHSLKSSTFAVATAIQSFYWKTEQFRTYHLDKIQARTGVHDD